MLARAVATQTGATTRLLLRIEDPFEWDDLHDNEKQHSCLHHQIAKVGAILDIVDRHVHGVPKYLEPRQYH